MFELEMCEVGVEKTDVKEVLSLYGAARPYEEKKRIIHGEIFTPLFYSNTQRVVFLTVML